MLLLCHCFGIDMSLLWHCFVIVFLNGYVCFWLFEKVFVMPIGTGKLTLYKRSENLKYNFESKKKKICARFL